MGAGGIVSTAFCLLYKLYTLRLTRKQVNGLLQHTDSPYIRALGRYEILADLCLADTEISYKSLHPFKLQKI